MPKNSYDITDRVKLVSVIHVEGLKMAAYRVRDPETHEWSKVQFHLTYNNTIMAAMSEESAKLFARFVTDTLPKN